MFYGGQEKRCLLDALKRGIKEAKSKGRAVTLDSLESLTHSYLLEMHCLSLDVMEKELSEIKCRVKKDNPVLGKKFAYIIQERVERIDHSNKNAVIANLLYNADEIAEVKFISEEKIPDDLFVGMRKRI